MKKYPLLILLFLVVLLLPFQIQAEDNSVKITEEMQACNLMEYIRSNGQIDYIYAYNRPQPWQEDESNPTYSSEAFVTRFYSIVLSKAVNCQVNSQGLPEVSITTSTMNKVTVPQKNDIVYCPINGKSHWAIVKSVNNDAVTLIEQNYRWQIPGDVNGDKLTNTIDSMLIAQYVSGMAPQNFDISKADVNSDGIVDMLDALLISQYYVDLINGFPSTDWYTTKDRVLSIEKDKPLFFREANTSNTVSGRVLTADGSTGIPGVTISFSNGASVVTDNNGNWSKDGLTGTFTVAPSKVGYIFDQSSKTVTAGMNNIYFKMTGFIDDFNNPGSGWRNFKVNNYDSGYKNGVYEIFSQNGITSEEELTPFIVSQDYTIEVDCRDLSYFQGKYNTYGLIFGYSASTCYYFNIDPSSQTYSLVFYNPSDKLQFGTEIFDERINKTAVNTLKVVKTGNQAELWINGNKIQTVTINNMIGNQVGIMSSNDSFGEIVHQYDNFKFTANNSEVPPQGYTVSGRVLAIDESAGIPGITVGFSDGSSVITDNNGNWSKSGLTGTITVTPSKVGYTFDQNNQTVTRALNNVSFKMTGFNDDFSNPGSGWRSYNSSDNKYTCNYIAGEYEIYNDAIPTVETEIQSFPVPNDYIIEVDCRDISSTQSNMNSHGIIFGYNPSNNTYYYFGIDMVRQAYEFEFYDVDNMQCDLNNFCALINKTGNNHLKVVKKGILAELWINGTKLKTVILSHNIGNRVGLKNYPLGSTQMTSRFDNFKFSPIVNNDPQPGYTVSGQVLNSDESAGIPGVTIIFDNGSFVTTDSNGNWSKDGLNGTATITPFKIGYTFDRDNQTVYGATNNIDFMMTGFSDDFHDSDSGWRVFSDADKYSCDYKTGGYEIYNNNGGKRELSPLSFPVSCDYIIEVDCSDISALQTNYNTHGIVFGYEPSASTYYYFNIDPSTQSYSLDYYDPTNPHYDTATKSLFINQTGSNNLKVVKKCDQVELWINGNKVKTVTIIYQMGNWVGIMNFNDSVSSSMTSRFDNFRFTPGSHIDTPPQGYTVSGRVLTTDESSGIPGVTISFSDGSSVITDSNGNWNKSGLNGSVTVTPSKVGYTFDQSSQIVTGALNNVNFKMTVFNDDFSNPDSGWRVFSDTDIYSCGYKNGGYQIYNNNGGLLEVELVPFFAPADKYTIEIECCDVSPSQTNYNMYGIVFGFAAATESFYFFNIDPSTQSFSLDYYHPSKLQYDTPTYCAQISKKAYNKLKVVRNSNQVELWINGIKVKTVTLNNPVGNQIGLLTFNDSVSSSMTIRFDNFKFTAN